MPSYCPRPEGRRGDGRAVKREEDSYFPNEEAIRDTARRLFRDTELEPKSAAAENPLRRTRGVMQEDEEQQPAMKRPRGL